MATDIVRRQKRPAPVMTGELRRRKRLSPLESFRIYTPWWLFGMGCASLAVMVMGIVAGITLFIWLGVTQVVLYWGWAIAWGFSIEDGKSWGFKKRRLHVVGGRSRKARGHREIEKTRIRDLDNAYPRYSTWVEREGSGIKVVILKHEKLSQGPLFPWKVSETSHTSNKQGTFEHQPISLYKIPDPTVDKLMAVIGEVEQIAEALEEEAYQEALKLHKLDAMAIAMQAPASAKAREAVRAIEDFVDA